LVVDKNHQVQEELFLPQKNTKMKMRFENRNDGFVDPVFFLRSLRSFAANPKPPSQARVILAARERKEHKDEDEI